MVYQLSVVVQRHRQNVNLKFGVMDQWTEGLTREVLEMITFAIGYLVDVSQGATGTTINRRLIK